MLISLVVLCIVLGLIFYLIQYAPIAEPFKSIALVGVIIVAILYLLQYLPHTGPLFIR